MCLANGPNSAIIVCMPRRSSVTATDEPVLIPWEDTQPQIEVLDWRKRARDFGLTPAERDEDEQDEPDLFRAERLLANEEPEADAAQQVSEQDEEEFSSAVLFREAPDEGLTTKDVDPVRAYLIQIGKTKLLTPPQEVKIGEEMEQARAGLLGALAHVPCAVCCLVRLANRVAEKSDTHIEEGWTGSCDQLGRRHGERRSCEVQRTGSNAEHGTNGQFPQ